MQRMQIGGLILIGLVVIATGFAPAARRASALECVSPDERKFTAPIVISDFADGLSSDGRGPYIEGTDAVVASNASNSAMLTIYSKDRIKNPRTYTMNVNNPVPGGGGVPLGIITDDRMGEGGGIMAQRLYGGDTAQNLQLLPSQRAAWDVWHPRP